MTEIGAEEATWRAALDKALGDAPRARSADGFAVGPLYPKADTVAAGPWRDSRRPVGILPRIDAADLSEANRQARDDVANGATGLTLVFAGAPTAHGGGLPITASDDLARCLEGLTLEGLALRLDAGTPAAALALAGFVAETGLATGALDIDIGLDPLDDAAVDIAATLRERGFAAPLWRADGRPFHAAGASEAQELASVLGAGVAAFRRLEPAGLDVAQKHLSFVLAADADQILTMAKVRALRRLWARIEAVSGLVPRPIRLHGETAWRLMAGRLPHTNLMRMTIACAAAILGGADSVTTLPFDAVTGAPDAQARRLARTIPLVLLDEAHLGRLVDPAAGAGAFEALTEALCQEAWHLFQGLEAEGGLGAALRSGRWPAAIAATHRRRLADHAEGRAPLVGVSAFVSADEGPLPARDEPGGPYGLPSLRSAAPFEAETAP